MPPSLRGCMREGTRDVFSFVDLSLEEQGVVKEGVSQFKYHLAPQPSHSLTFKPVLPTFL